MHRRKTTGNYDIGEIVSLNIVMYREGVKENIKHIIRSSLTLKKINIDTNINTTLFCTIDGIFMN